MKVRTRFAPSPTGFLHVGGLRTALYDYLYAHHMGGTFILRIEDTDQTRKVEGALESLKNILSKFGIAPTEGPGYGGDKGPYIQSERLDIYQKHVNILLGNGHAYRCFCTEERLDTMRAAQQAQKLNPKYDRRCLSVSKDESDRRAAAGEKHVVRMKVPAGPTLTFEDLIRGAISYERDSIDDQVLMKSDGFPTYHLANVVDDHHMEITHVIRGEEWISSTPKHILLYEFFGWKTPLFAHAPLLLNPDKSKLSKRQGDVAAEDFLDKGYLPEALLNFVALCGWHTADDREFFTLDEMVKEFTLDRINKAGAVFDTAKLLWMNKEYIKRLAPQDFIERVTPYLKDIKAQFNGDDRLFQKLVLQTQNNIGLLNEVSTAIAPLLANPESFSWGTQDFFATPESKAKTLKVFQSFQKALEPNKSKSSSELETLMHDCANSLKNEGLKPKDIFMPMRYAFLGQPKGPEVPILTGIFGAEETLKRINLAVQALQK